VQEAVGVEATMMLFGESLVPTLWRYFIDEASENGGGIAKRTIYSPLFSLSSSSGLRVPAGF
jgi:hypothetical protein